MIGRLFRWGVFLAVVAAGAAWFLTGAKLEDPDAVAGLTGDAARGELVFHAGGCASCHAAENAEGEAKLVLAGGRAFPSDFGTFYAPNISPDPDHGIGDWSALDLLNAMRHGTSPEGSHYYPAFPYTAYAKAETADIVDLHAYMMTLPANATPSRAHDVGFPFSIRRSLGGWKLLFLKDDWVVDPGDLSPEETRGRYLAEALGHCGECHTSRNPLGGLDTGSWLGGAPNPSGRGRIPNITPAKLTWSMGDMVEYFTSGFTPEFDTVGGHMTEVVENLSQLPVEDRQAIAAYLLRVDPVE